MNFEKELFVLLKARYPIISISTIEEDRLEYNIRQISQSSCRAPRNLYIWDFIEGYKTQRGLARKDPLAALNLVEKISPYTPTLFLLKDFNRFLKDITVSRKLRNLSRVIKFQPKTLLLVDLYVQVPNELKEYITTLQFPLPTPREVRIEIKYIRRKMGFRRSLTPKFTEKLVQACQGLSLEKIRRVLGKAIVMYRKIDRNCISLFIEEKKQIISQTNLLEFCATEERLQNIGGSYNLKRWLLTRKKAFSGKAATYKLHAPRGVLLIGLQGTGKSLLAKAVAGEWKLPLLRLDVGRVFGGIVGESEYRMREVIHTTETLAPCILWIDEIDKAFPESEQNHDSGTANRVLGTFATWLAEKTLPVFVIGTANDMYALPPELTRKGRFDEIFYIGTPSMEERQVIFEIQLKKFRPDTWYRYNTKALSRSSRRFSGAEIEQAIMEAMYTAFYEKREFTTRDIEKALKQTIPLLKTDPYRSELTRSWASSGKVRFA